MYVIDRLEKQPNIKLSSSDEYDVDIIIPVRNCTKTLAKCLSALQQSQGVRLIKVIIVNDHSTDDSEQIIDSYNQQLPIIKINLDSNLYGKAAALKCGMDYTTASNVFLMDADIILHKDALRHIWQAHLLNNNSFTSCLIYPYESNNDTWKQKIINNDRFYRQNILQRIRRKAGVANFPGGLGLVNINRYREVLVDGFLEDLSSTYNILTKNGKIDVITIVLAYELERQSFFHLLTQRIRWTIGNIHNFPLFIKTVIKISGWHKKFLLGSYFVMWYMQYYFIVMGVIYSIWAKNLFGIIPGILYLIQIIISNLWANKSIINEWKIILLHCIIFPLIITSSLFGAVANILITRKLFFRNYSFYRR